MDEAWTLILLSLCMLIGCYLAGSVPLAFNLAEDKLKLVTVLGAGLLVGTALAVIIPEGVHTLYGAQLHHDHESQSHSKRDAGAPSEIEVAGVMSPVDAPAASSDEVHTEMHNLIGVALVLGFIFMLLVDQLSNGNTQTNGDTEAVTSQNRHKITATIGLVVHAAADGIALGAAATTSQAHVEMIVFIAIMLHKAPAAFGLVSFLLHEGLDRVRIRKHLAVFSAAAPLLAIITYFGLSQHDKETLSRVQATGLAMLFSAGTFLYVATVHVIPELLQMSPSRNIMNDSSVTPVEHKGFTKLELLTMVVGAVFPLLLSLGHHH